jgi:NCS1 family nucleobase:cation symporter-1
MVKFSFPRIRTPPEYGIEPVKKEYRYLGFLEYFILWSSLGVGLLVLLAGTLLVPALNFRDALIAIIIGTAIGNIPLVLAGWIGSEYAIPTMVTIRPSFGIRGSYFSSFLNLIQLIGWTSFEIIIMAKAANTISIATIDYSNITLWIIIFTILCLAMAIGGPLLIIRYWLEKFAIWIVYGTSIWIAYYILSRIDFNLLAIEGQGGLPFLLAIDLVIAMPISWMPLAADYLRFSKDKKRASVGTYFGFFLANFLFYSLGILFVLGAGVYDPILAISTVAYGIPALLLILVDETDNAFADIYSAAISVQNMLPHLSQKMLILIIGVIGMLTALIVPIEQYTYFLLLIGSLFIPLFGVVITDYLFVKRRKYITEELYLKHGSYWYQKGLNIRAIAAWLFGVVSYHLIVFYASWLGASIPSLIIAAVIYIILMGVKK